MKCRMLPALIAALSVSAMALAGGDSPSPAAKQAAPSPAVKKPAPQVEVKVLEFGKVIQVGADGKVLIKEFNGGLPQEILEKLPKDVQASASQTPASPAQPASGAPKALFTASTSGKLKVVVVHDGKSQEMEFDLGGSHAQAACQLGNLSTMFQAAGGTLPDDAKNALQIVTQALQAQNQAPGGPAKRADEVNAKLDRILEHLERLEADVKALQTKAAK